MVLAVKVAIPVNTAVAPILLLQRVIIAQQVFITMPMVKLHVCPAFRENFKILQVNPRAKHVLKIRKVNKQIRLNVIPAVMVKSLKKAVLNALNAKRVKQELGQTVLVNHAHRANTVRAK